jgi:hypothetical protein
VEKSIEKLGSVFGFFVDNEWVFDGENLENLRLRMSEEEKRVFFFDVAEIHWEYYLKFWCWGLMTHILKDSYDPPDQDRHAVLFMGDGRPFSDFMFALRNSRGLNTKTKRRGAG